MKTDNLLIIGAAAAALYLITSTRKQVVSGSTRPQTWPVAPNTAPALNNGGTVPVTQISNTALPGDYGWGWQYFSDGTAISPQGQYYLNGELVWSPASGMMGYGV